MESEKTIQELFKLWFWNFQNPSQNQFSNLYHITIAILKYFDKKNKDVEGKPNYQEEIQKKLPRLFYRPIETLSEKHKELSIKSKLDWNIPQLEWCYYRDTKFRTKLAKEYYPDTSKEQQTKKIVLAEMISILSAFKDELFERIIQILLDENLNIYIPINMKEIEQIQGQEN